METSLLKFKSSGVKSISQVAETTNVDTLPNSTRILVVNSKKGEVNTLVPIRDYTQYLKKFDAISEADERKGNWGSRASQLMTSVAPIYVLNLRKFDDEKDVAGLVEISSKIGGAVNGVVKNKPFRLLHNTQQFWKRDPKKLITSDNLDKLLVFANLGASNVSIVVRKSKTKDFNQTFQTWYSHLSRTIPQYINPLDKVKDSMIDVHIFRNSFDENSKNNPNFGYCFDTAGNIKKTVVNSSNEAIDGVEQLIKIAESGYLGTYSGSIIKNFKNESNASLDIVEILNSYSSETGLLVGRNDALFDESIIWEQGEDVTDDGFKKPLPIDLRGHSLIHVGSNGLPILDTDKVETFSYEFTPTISGVYNIDPTGSFGVYVPKNDYTFTKISAILNGRIDGDSVVHTGELNKLIFVGSDSKPNVGDSFAGFDGNLSTVTAVRVVTQKKMISKSNTEKLPIQPFGDDESYSGSHDWEAQDGVGQLFKYVNAGTVFPKDTTNTYFVYPPQHPLAGLPLCFDKYVDGLAFGVIHNPSKTTSFVLASNVPYTVDEVKTLISTKTTYKPSGNKQVVTDYDISAERLEDASKLGLLITNNGVVDYIYEVTLDKQLLFGSTTNTTIDLSQKLAIGENTKYVDDAGVERIVYTKDMWVVKVTQPDELVTSYKPITLKAYKQRKEQFIDGTAERTHSILSVLKETSIDNGLQNKDDYKWMYIVDSFKSHVEPNVKYEFKDVAKNRETARAIYNLPSPTQLAECTNPYFADEIRGDFKAMYVPQGGNTELPHSNTFSLPSEDGYYAYGFGSHFVIGDEHMPPAPIISNLFARKHKIGKPYMILAGTNGLISADGVTGVDYSFIERNDGTGDRDYLEPFGYNVVVKKSSGLQIYSNRTSYNTVDSPISSIHTSEVVMYIQQRIAEMLESFVFKNNTAQNRLIIKEKADDICNEALQSGAISGFVNQCDDLNNTADVISNRIGILDTTLFGNNGMEIIIHRTTVDSVTNMASFNITSGN